MRKWCFAAAAADNADIAAADNADIDADADTVAVVADMGDCVFVCCSYPFLFDNYFVCDL